jgi:hypothetical protein
VAGRTPLDPIVSLTVGIAEAPGSFAFFLGSGASRDAGIPTGGEVRLQAMGELYRVHEKTEDTPATPELTAWFAASEFGELSYSGILELLMPDAAVRRDYLAQHFGGREPGETHTRLADLSAQGLIRVFVTTNFDRLLEHALQARGIEPVVVTADSELERAPAREHAECFVVKVHGDYVHETIRNTEAELAELEPGITTELKAIVDRYGLVVTGYSGGDEAIARVVRARRARYGLYWVSRSVPGEPARTLIEATAGRVILRDSAAEFLGDLQGRLAVFRAHPSGLTPTTVNAQAIQLLRNDDRVGLRELVKVERREVFAVAESIVDEYQAVSSPSEEQATDIAERVAAAVDRYRGVLLPLIEHRSPAFDDESAVLARIAETRHFDSGLTAWIKFPQWLVWMLVNSCGAFAVETDNLAAAGRLLRTTFHERDAAAAPLGLIFPGEAARVVSAIYLAQRGITQRAAPWYDMLIESLGNSELARNRYAEIADGGDATRRGLNDFGFLRSLYAGLKNDRTIAEWAMFSGGGERIARRLNTDEAFRARVAREVFDMLLEDFEAGARQALRAGLPQGAIPGQFSNSDAHLTFGRDPDDAIGSAG